MQQSHAHYHEVLYEATETARIMYAVKPRPLSEEHEATETERLIHACRATPTVREVQ